MCWIGLIIYGCRYGPKLKPTSLLIGFEGTTDRNLTESQEMFKPSPELKWVRTQILILLSIEIWISFCYFFKEKLHLNGLDRCDKCIPFLNYPLCHRRYCNPSAMFPARISTCTHKLHGKLTAQHASCMLSPNCWSTHDSCYMTCYTCINKYNSISHYTSTWSKTDHGSPCFGGSSHCCRGRLQVWNRCTVVWCCECIYCTMHPLFEW